MAFFGSSKSKKDSGPSDQVLAYLEEAQRVKGQLFLVDSRKAELPALVANVDEDAGTFSLGVSGPFLADKGAKITVYLLAESTRLTATCKLMDTRPGTVVLELPEALSLAERRKQGRARLNPKEGATVTALTGLFDGIGVNGVLESLSEGGCRIRVEKAMNLKDERRLPLGTALLPAGQPLMLVKLNKVPRCPAVMELSGKVAYLSDSGGLVMGIVFEKPRVDAAAAIRALVSTRGSAVPTAVPPKARRRPQEVEESLLPEADPGRGLHREAKEVAAPREEHDPKAGVSSVAPIPEVESEPVVPHADSEPQAPVRNQALVRLKKRTRTILLFAPGAQGDLVRDFLLEDGYGKVLQANHLQELAVLLDQPASIGLLFVDTSLPVLECMEFVAKQTEEHHNMPPVIMAAEELSRAMVMVAHRSGVSQLLVKPYVLDESFAALVEEQMGI